MSGCDDSTVISSNTLNNINTNNNVNEFNNIECLSTDYNVIPYTYFECLTTFVSIGNSIGAKIKAVVDSGASTTVMRTDMWLQSGYNKDQLLPSTLPFVNDAAGKPMKIWGRMDITICWSTDLEMIIPVHIIDGLCHNILIGNDVLFPRKAKIDYDTSSLLFPHENPIPVSCQLTDTTLNQTLCLRLTENAIIPSRMQKLFTLHVPVTNGKFVIVEPVSTLPRSIFLSHSVCQVQSGSITFPLVNVSVSDVAVSTGLELGCISVRKDGDILALDHLGQHGEPAVSINTVNWSTLPVVKSQLLTTQLSHLPSQQRVCVEQFVEKYQSCFLAGDEIPPVALDVEAHILGGDDLAPVYKAPYRVAPVTQGRIDEEMDKLLKSGVVSSSTSPWGAPVVLVPKSNGKWRLCIDYRGLNEVVDTIQWPLPRMDDCINALRQAQIMTSMDLCWGFWAISISPETRHKTAFSTQKGHYEWNRMPMGWKGAPAVFQKSMDFLLSGILGLSALCYLDDVLVFSSSFDEHMVHLDEVFSRFHQANRFVKLEKMQWCLKQVDFLGVRVGNGEIQMQAKSIQSILSLPLPIDQHAVRSFLGAVGAYRRFIYNFAVIAQPLFDLLQSGVSVSAQWSDPHLEAFNSLKQIIASDNILIMPDYHEEFHMILSSSKLALGGTLGQLLKGRFKPISFISKKTPDADLLKYDMGLELISLDYLFQQCRHIVGQSVVHVHTCFDLSWVLNPRNVNGKVLKAAMRLQQYIIKLHKTKGQFDKISALGMYNDPDRSVKQAQEELRITEARTKSVLLPIPTLKSLVHVGYALTFDGGFRAGIRRGALGWVLWSTDHTGWKVINAGGCSTDSEDATVNNQEFTALIVGLKAAVAFPIEYLRVYGDSKLIIALVLGLMQPKKDSMKSLWSTVNQLRASFCSITFEHIPRRFNAPADHMVNLAMDLTNGYEVQLNDVPRLSTSLETMNTILDCAAIPISTIPKVATPMAVNAITLPVVGFSPSFSNSSSVTSTLASLSLTSITSSAGLPPRPTSFVTAQSFVPPQPSALGTIPSTSVSPALFRSTLSSKRQQKLTSAINAITRNAEPLGRDLTSDRYQDVRLRQMNTPWMKRMIQYKESQLLLGTRKEQEYILNAHSSYEVLSSVLWFQDLSTSGSQRWRMVLPVSMRKDVLHAAHTSDLGGHLALFKTYERVAADYFWPKIRRDVQFYIQSCKRCSTVKAQLWRELSPLQRNNEDIPGSFHTIAVDYITDMPLSTLGNRHLLVFVDVFTRWAEVIPVADLLMSTFVSVFVKHIVCVFGCPVRLVSDRGGQFIGDLARAVYETLNVSKSTTTAYHPMANGLCERFNQTLIAGLKSLGNLRQDDWDLVLDPYLFAYRTSVHAVTKFSPFELVFGRSALTPTNAALRFHSGNHLACDRREFFRQLKWDMDEMRVLVHSREQQAFADRKRRFDVKAGKTVDCFEVGDRVWLYDPAVPAGFKSKIYVKWYGPFTILSQESPVTYTLDLPTGSRAHAVIHANRLKAFVDRMNWPTISPADLEDTDTSPLLPYEFYESQSQRVDAEVECIVAERVKSTSTGGRWLEYLVHKKNTDASEDVWLHEKKISAGGLIYEFKNRQQDQQRQAVLSPGEGIIA